MSASVNTSGYCCGIKLAQHKSALIMFAWFFSPCWKSGSLFGGCFKNEALSWTETETPWCWERTIKRSFLVRVHAERQNTTRGEMFPRDVISSAEPPVDDEMPKNYFRVVLSLLVIFQNSPQGNKAASLWLPGPSLSKTHSSIKREVSCCWSWSPFTSADSALQSRGQSRRGGQGGGRGVISTQSISGRWRWPATFSYLTR